MYMCGMPTDRAVDHSAALIVIRYSRTRAVYVTIFIVITTLRTRQLEMSRPAVILIVQLFEVYEDIRTWARGLKFACSECNRAFVSKNNLSVHVRDAHGEDRGPFSCPHCNKMSKNKSSLRNHLYYTHNIRARAVSEQQAYK